MSSSAASSFRWRQKLFESKLDGEAVLSIVLAIFLLKHDAAARSCQRVMSAMDSDECLLVFESNEYLTLSTDPDPLRETVACIYMCCYMSGD